MKDAKGGNKTLESWQSSLRNKNPAPGATRIPGFMFFTVGASNKIICDKYGQLLLKYYLP